MGAGKQEKVERRKRVSLCGLGGSIESLFFLDLGFKSIFWRINQFHFFRFSLFGWILNLV